VELIKMSTDGQVATTLSAARQAVTQKGAKFIGAVMTSPEHAALNKLLPSLGALSLNSLGQDESLIGKNCSKNAFHIVQSDDMNVTAVAKGLKAMPGKKWAILTEDYSTGHSAAAAFAKAVKKAGKQVVSTQFAPLNTTEFGPFITKIENSGADAVFSGEYGADGVAFVNQAAQFGLTKKVGTVLGLNMVSEPLFPVLGNKVVGFYNNVGYNVHADNAQNKKFVQDYTKQFGSAPYYVPADNYLAAETLFAGIKKAGSVDPAKVGAALDGLTLPSVDGNVRMRAADHQLIRPNFLGKVVKTPKGLAFKIVDSMTGPETSPAANPDCHM
ncbi:MAG: ABC transporter substrate-binding protein, partial [Sciscionella sp.]